MRGITIVNFHLIEACNFKCGFCYSKDLGFEKTLNEEYQKRLIEALAHSGYFRKINFAGGEPTLVKHLPKLISHAKQSGFREVSLVTNGSRIDESWLREVNGYLDILALSIDSLDPEVNLKSGRHDRKGKLVPPEKIYRIAQVYHELSIYLKVNTVVHAYNKHETLAPFIIEIGARR